MSARLAPSSRPLPSLFVAFLSFFVLPWPSPLRVINVIIIIPCLSSLARSSAQVSRSHRSLDSRLSQRGFLIKPTVNQKCYTCVGVYLESYTRGGAIPNEMGSARCRATPALNHSADETRTPASRCLPSTCPCRLPPLGLDVGVVRRRRRSLLRTVHAEEEEEFRIVYARGPIPTEVGPARCRATPALTSQPTKPAHPDLLVPAAVGRRRRRRILFRIVRARSANPHEVGLTRCQEKRSREEWRRNLRCSGRDGRMAGWPYFTFNAAIKGGGASSLES